MAKKKSLKSLKKGDEITALTKEELRDMRLKISIEIPKDIFDQLLTSMIIKGGEQDKKDN